MPDKSWSYLSTQVYKFSHVLLLNIAWYSWKIAELELNNNHSLTLLNIEYMCIIMSSYKLKSICNLLCCARKKLFLFYKIINKYLYLFNPTSWVFNYTNLNLYNNALMKHLLKCLIYIFNIFTSTYVQTLVLPFNGQPLFKQNWNYIQLMYIRISSYKLS